MPKKPAKPPKVEVISMKKPPAPKTRSQVYKRCSECGREQPVINFYSNRLFATQMFKDRWCKDCIAEKCFDEKTFRIYLYKNNRVWKPELWAEAMKLATMDVALTIEYSQLETDEERQKMMQKRAILVALTLMNKPAYYGYSDNASQDFGVDIESHIEAEKASDREAIDPYYRLPIFSPEWKGTYTQYEIDSMNKYLDSIVQARGIEDEVALSYARQFVAQSALVDRFAQRMRDDPTKENIEAHKSACLTLDQTSKAANIAPAYKKNDQTVGLGSLGVFIKLCESGKRMGSEPSFPPDQIDAILKDFRHIASSMDGSGGLWDTPVETLSDVVEE
jgi:hypothetical protein